MADCFIFCKTKVRVIMPNISGTKIVANLIAWAIDVIVGSVLLLVGFALDMESIGPFGSAIKWSKTNASYIIIISFLFLIIARLLKWFLKDKHPAELRLDWLVSEALDEFRNKRFSGLSKEPRDENRVTLFKRVHYCWRMKHRGWFFWPYGFGRWPWSGWLVVIQRSGHATQDTGTAFLAPDDAHNAVGIAGKA